MMAAYIRWVRRLLPSPFTIALLLSMVSVLAVFIFNASNTGSLRVAQVASWWVTGLFQVPLLAFAVQMMLMLVLGHALALSPIFTKIIDAAVRLCRDTASAAAVVCSVALLTGLFNWGLGLIVGAILARKVGEQFMREGRPLNYPLIGAAGYGALMIWHGGISGSALIKVAEPGHLSSLMQNSAAAIAWPASIGLDATVFSAGNLITSALVLLAVPLVLYWVGKKTSREQEVPDIRLKEDHPAPNESIGAERLDRSNWLGWSAGLIMFSSLIAHAWFQGIGFFQFFIPNHINLMLLGLALMAHGRVVSFLRAIASAIDGASSILIQFPLYFGIMGLVQSSGLIDTISAFFIAHSSETTLPVYTFLSAGLVNLFVPSGGGQWVVQGPIILEAANDIGVGLPKAILSLAYGDQITNMLQPFWALPLLGITQLSAKKILPYTLIMFGVGAILYLFGILVLL